MSKLKTDWVVVATSGPTIDGREIDPKWLTDAAEVYNPDEHTAMLWPFHASAGWRAFTNNYGLVDALKAEKVGDKVQLKARLIPNRFLTEANEAGQKLFTSIEVKENYLGTGKFFVSGIAVTDTPASINTTRLQFSQGDSIHMGNAEELNFTLQSDDEQAKRSFFSGLFSVGRNKQENDMNEKQFGQLMDAINKTGERLDKLEENVAQFSAKDAPKDTRTLTHWPLPAQALQWALPVTRLWKSSCVICAGSWARKRTKRSNSNAVPQGTKSCRHCMENYPGVVALAAQTSATS